MPDKNNELFQCPKCGAKTVFNEIVRIVVYRAPIYSDKSIGREKKCESIGDNDIFICTTCSRKLSRNLNDEY